MKSTLMVIATAGFFILMGCSGENPYPTGTDQDEAIVSLKNGKKPKDTQDPKPPKGPALGTCPDIYYESSKELSNGAIVTWSSSFNGFDYAGGDYTVMVTWSVENGDAEFVSLGDKKKTWTPKGVIGMWSFAGNALTVSMDPMHRAIDTDPAWQGYIGNGHFKLELNVTNENGSVKAKLGVNVHLENPDDGYGDRCPG